MAVGYTGQTLTLSLFPHGSDTAAVSGLTLTEATNRKGVYTTTTTAALTGLHMAVAFSGSTPLGQGYVLMDDTTANHVVQETAAIANTTATRSASAAGITKNTAQVFQFLMVDSNDHTTPKTSLTVTATRSIDGGAFASCTNSVTELSNGIYTITLSASDLNGDVITFKFSATGADTRYITIVTTA